MSESENNYTDINSTVGEPSCQEKIQKIYIRKIAEAINEKCRTNIRPDMFKKPFDPPAFRMALEFVATYLVEKGLRMTLDLANFESNNLIKPDRHLEKYLAHNLRVEWEYPIIPQLIGIHRTRTESGSTEGEVISPTVPRGVKLHRYVEEQNNYRHLIQSTDESEFSTQSILQEDQLRREKLNEKLEKRRSERRHRPKHVHDVPDVIAKGDKNKMSLRKEHIDDYFIPNHSDTFTELQTKDSPAKLWDPTYALDAVQRAELAKRIKMNEERSKKMYYRPGKTVQNHESSDYTGYTDYGYEYYESLSSNAEESNSNQGSSLVSLRGGHNLPSSGGSNGSGLHSSYGNCSSTYESMKYVSQGAKKLTERQKERRWSELGRQDSDDLYEMSRYNVANMLGEGSVPLGTNRNGKLAPDA